MTSGAAKAIGAAAGENRLSLVQRFGVAVAIVLTVLAAHGRALPHPFHMDDPIVIGSDPRIAACDTAAIFSQEYWPGAAAGNRVWRPLTTLSLAAQWQIARSPMAYRSVNLAIHACSVMLLFLLARAVLGATLPALAAALMYAVHPLHTTPVNQIVDRADFLATMLTLTTCLLFLGELRSPRVWRSGLLSACVAAALLSKESAIAIVGIVPALHVWAARGHRDAAAIRWSAMLRAYAAVALAVVCVLGMRTQVLGGVGRDAAAINPLDNVLANPAVVLQPGESAALARWGTPIAVMAMAAAKFVWPHPLSWDYSTAAIDIVRGWNDARLLAGIVLLCAAAIAAVVSLRRTRATFVAIAIGLGGYAVVANVFFLVGALFAERYLNLAAVGLSLLAVRVVCGALTSISLRHADRAGFALLMLPIAAFVWVSLDRHSDFSSVARLNAADLASYPQSARLWASRASDEITARKWQDALTSAERSTQIIDTDPRSHRLLGIVRYQLRDYDGALAAMQRSIALGGIASENTVTIASGILKERGRYADAIAILDRFFAAGGRSANLENNLAWYLLTATPESLRDPQRAVTLAQRAFEAQPGEPDFADTYAEALLVVGRVEDARGALRRTLALLAIGDPRRRALEAKLTGIR